MTTGQQDNRTTRLEQRAESREQRAEDKGSKALSRLLVRGPAKDHELSVQPHCRRLLMSFFRFRLAGFRDLNDRCGVDPDRSAQLLQACCERLNLFLLLLSQGPELGYLSFLLLNGSVFLQEFIK
jgi:hypothetical protein